MFKPWQVILFLLVVVLGVVGFIFWYYSSPNMMAKPDTNTEPVAAVPTAPAPAEPEIGPSTDEGLDADLASVDAQLKVVDTNSASVEQSLNDKPVTQTE
jgi:hypothetical protein